MRVDAPGGIRLVTGGKLEAAASQVAVDTSKLDVNAGNAEFSGVGPCDKLIANSVVASSYTPGQGNVL